MRIGEISELTGLSISNIRFYEKKGLIEPSREAENKYREYTEEDLLRLKQITLYRKMNLSIEHIGLIFCGEMSLEEAVQKQLIELERKKEMLEGSISLCQIILESGTVKEREVDYYLNYVKEEEAKGTRFAELDEFLEDFADFVQITRFWGDPYVGKLLLNKRIFRVITSIAVLVLVTLPFVVVWDSYKDHGMIQGKAIAFCCIWIVGLGPSFIHFRKKNKGNSSK